MKLYADRVAEKPLAFSGGMQLGQPYFNSPLEASPNQWVKLIRPINDYSDDEALLLCQQSVNEWVAWVPGYGEAILHPSQFC